MMPFEVKIMKEKFRRFMIGRYGVDAFGRFLLILTVIFWGINLFVDNIFLYSWAFVILIYAYFRMFSRNTSKRYQENLKYLQIKNKVVSKFKTKQSQLKQRKTHHIYRCPSCKQKIRIPKGKGRICITCPKCKTEFTKVS